MNKKIKKYIIFLFVVTCTFILTYTDVFANSINQFIGIISSYKVVLNGEGLVFKNPVINIDGILYAPINEFSKKLGIKTVYNKTERTVELINNDILISVYLCKAEVTTMVYHIDLFKNGRIATTIGVGEIPIEAIEGFDDEMTLPEVPPKLTRYMNISNSKMKKVKNLISKISNAEIGDDGITDGGWNVFVLHNGINHRYVYERDRKYWGGSEHMYEIVQTLIKYSPIEIVFYNNEQIESFSEIYK